MSGQRCLHQLIPLGAVAIACRRCPRAGSYRVATLIERFGADATVDAMLKGVSADCPRQIPSPPPYDRCGVNCPSLLALP